ncbi:MAG: hypothetical protein J6333_07480, partial [Planctomycetes bacterium]|nr:hypothetical protein [Planctomycetota bacterium]
TLEGRAGPEAVVAMVEALPGIVAARHAKCLQGLSAAQWARVVKAAPRLGRHCPKGLLPGLLRHSPEAAGPLGEAVLGAIDAGEWFALLKDRPSLGPLCPYAFAKLTDAQLEELAKPGSPAGVRVPACRCRFSRKVGRFLAAVFALALAAGAALWLLDYIFSGMTNDTIDTVAIVCAVIVGVTLFGLIVKKVDISGRDVRFIGSVLIMIGWGVWWLIKFVLTTVRDWFN